MDHAAHPQQPGAYTFWLTGYPAMPLPAANQFTTFAQCCQVSFSRPSSTPLRGNGVSNFECYLAPGVFDPPCYVFTGSNCLLSNDINLCRSGGWDHGPRVSACWAWHKLWQATKRLATSLWGGLGG